ncbi:MAG TPA: glycosyltransferase [Solirubrobacteraceae bacterium]|nr:glycosyltransferase [Solirubrobacteraceae bacterium]
MPVLNEERHIEASVDAMRRQRFDGSMEFLVIDGGSADRTLEILRELAAEDPRIRILSNPLRTTPSGLNVGLAHARGRWVARMDAHTAYPADYVALGVKRLADGDTRWVSGPPIATGNGPVSRAVALALRTRLGRGGSRKWASDRDSEAREYDLDSGVFAGVWARETLLTYGGWDERWARNQDSEMAGRFLERDERLVCLPAMASEYTPRNSVASLWRQYLEYGDYREWTAVRHPHTMRRSHLLAPALVVTAAAAVIGPRPARRAARAGLVVYAAALAAAGATALRDADDPGAAALVPVALAAMHFGHGAGMLRGVARHGVPAAAVARALGLEGVATRFDPEPMPVFAPSLERDDA